MGKLFNGVAVLAGGLAGNYVGEQAAAMIPQATVAIPGTKKALNLAGAAGAVAVGGFGPKGGVIGGLVQGFAGGLAAGSDPIGTSAGYTRQTGIAYIGIGGLGV